MKQFTFQKALAIAISLSAPLGAQAQFFQKADGPFQGLHRGTPAIADINNDGWMDIYYAGEYYGDDTDWGLTSWDPAGILLVNKGDGTFTTHITKNSEINNDGKFSAFGLPPTIWNMTRFIDFDNDGCLDFISTGRTGDGWNPFDAGSLYEGKYTLLFKNGGAAADYQFTMAGDNGGLPQGIQNEFGETWMGGMNKSSISFGDYNRDGFIDMVIQGYRNWKEGDETKGARYVGLWKNNGDGTFAEQKVFAPIPYSENKHPDGLFDVDEETFEATPLMVMKPMTHGAVMFGDLNNDGWLDIVSTGWIDGTDGGAATYLYKNNGDGTFAEVDAQELGLTRVQESDIAMADFDNDGRLDLLFSGTPYGGDETYGGKVAAIFYNRGEETGEFKFEASTAQAGNGLEGASETHLAVIDFDHDGLNDVMQFGGYTYNSAWHNRLFLQNADGTFKKVEDSENGLAPSDQFNQGGGCIGRLFSATSVDMAGVQDRDNQRRLDVYKNLNDEDAEAPEMPTGVKAEYSGGKLVITWAGNESNTGTAYNVYAKNKATGAIAAIIPADTETGALRVIQDLQILLRSAEPAAMKYEMTLPEGSYEVGVAAVNPDAVSSRFAKAEAVSTGISEREAEAAVAAKAIYTLSGITTGTAGKHGLYIVKEGNKISKIIK